jgi:hypothetical protein
VSTVQVPCAETAALPVKRGQRVSAQRNALEVPAEDVARRFRLGRRAVGSKERGVTKILSAGPRPLSAQDGPVAVPLPRAHDAWGARAARPGRSYLPSGRTNPADTGHDFDVATRG